MPNIKTLFRSIEAEDLQAVIGCLDAGVDANKMHPLGISISPLSFACTLGNAEIVSALLERGADVNMRAVSDFPELEPTALHDISASKPPIPNQIAVAAALIDAGAQVNSLVCDMTSLDLCSIANNRELGRYIKTAGGLTGRELAIRSLKANKRILLREIQSLRRWRRSRLKTWGCISQLLGTLVTYANYHPIGWSPILKKLNTHNPSDRLGNLVFGNLFTSHKYPWPKIGDMALAPLLQIDLRMLREKFVQSRQGGSFPDVDGLLQVWETNFKDREVHGDGIVRIIPRSEVSVHFLANEIPEIDSDDYKCIGGEPLDLRLGALITGWRRAAPKWINNPDFLAGLKCNPCSDLESTAVAVDAGDMNDMVQSLQDGLSNMYKTRLFGVSDYQDAWERYIVAGEQCLFQIGGFDDGSFNVPSMGVGHLVWNAGGFRFYWDNYR